MDYEKEYKKLKADIEKAYLFAQTDSTKSVLEHILPELRKSEDERIREELIEKVKETPACIGFSDKNAVLTWLEKQGQQKPAWTEEDSMIQNGIILDGVVYELTTGFPDNACSLCGNCELHEKCMELSDGSPCYFFSDSFRKVFRKVKMERKL